MPFEMPTHDDAAISEWKGTEKSSRVSVESNAKHQTSDTSNSNMFWIILIVMLKEVMKIYLHFSFASASIFIKKGGFYPSF